MQQHHHAARHLVRGEPRPAPGQHRVDREGRVRLGLDNRGDELAAMPVRQACDNRAAHAWDLLQHPTDFLGVYLLPGYVEGLADAARERDATLPVEDAQVPGQESAGSQHPAFFGRRQLGQRHRAREDQDSPLSAGGQRATILVDDLDAHAVHGGAYRAFLVRRLGRAIVGNATALGAAVEDVHLVPRGAEERSRVPRGQRRPRCEAYPQVREVRQVPERGKSPDHGGHCGKVGNAGRCQSVGERRGECAGREDEGDGCQELRYQAVPDPVRVRERYGCDRHVAGAETHRPHDLHRVRDQLPQADCHYVRQPGGAGRQLEDCRPLGQGDRLGAGAGRDGGAAVASHDFVSGQAFGSGDDPTGARRRRRALDLVGRRRGIDEGDSGSEQAERGERPDKLRTVGQREQHRGSGCNDSGVRSVRGFDLNRQVRSRGEDLTVWTD